VFVILLRVFPEKLTVNPLVKKFLAVMEREVSQEPVKGQRWSRPRA